MLTLAQLSKMMGRELRPTPTPHASPPPQHAPPAGRHPPFRLTALDPVLVRYEFRDGSHCAIYVDTVAEAQGVRFLCPKCLHANGGRRGTHYVECWSRSAGVPEHVQPGPGRWRLVGTGLHDLSLMEEKGQSRSVLLLSGCRWHGYVTDGMVTDA